MPEGRKTRSDSDYVFRLSGISRIERTVASRHETPRSKDCGGDEVGDTPSLRDGELPARSAAIPATAGIQSL